MARRNDAPASACRASATVDSVCTACVPGRYKSGASADRTLDPVLQIHLDSIERSWVCVRSTRDEQALHQAIDCFDLSVEISESVSVGARVYIHATPRRGTRESRAQRASPHPASHRL